MRMFRVEMSCVWSDWHVMVSSLTTLVVLSAVYCMHKERERERERGGFVHRCVVPEMLRILRSAIIDKYNWREGEGEKNREGRGGERERDGSIHSTFSLSTFHKQHNKYKLGMHAVEATVQATYKLFTRFFTSLVQRCATLATKEKAMFW